jgi:hypothetical protein
VDNNPPPYPDQNPVPQPGYPQLQPGFMPTQPAFSPGPGGFPQPGFQPAPRKRRPFLWIGLIVLLLLIAGGGFSYYYFQIRSTPLRTLQAYCTAIKNNDAQGLYNTLSTEQQDQRSVNGLQQGFQILTLVTGGFKDCTVDTSSILENDPTATGNVTYFTNRGLTTHGTVHLVDENGQWKVAQGITIP